jgi:hypothetical protein
MLTKKTTVCNLLRNVMLGMLGMGMLIGARQIYDYIHKRL